jgi:transcriptional regulator with PAS, ATPase and Fis domain
MLGACRRMIAEALRESGGNKQKAAQALGLSRQGLIKKLKRLGI